METTVDTALPSLSPSDFRALIGRADAPLLLDVRRRETFAASDRLLPGALHCAPEDLADFARSEAPREAVVYCAYGHHLSQDAVRTLRAAGWDARFLEGGIAGGEDGVDRLQDIARWREAALPTIRKRPDLGVGGERPSRWITRARPKIDRIACPWLIRRFLDPQARVLFVDPDQVVNVARESGGVPFDIQGVELSHEGERCSFDTMLRLFDLESEPALARLALIVRGADTSRMDLMPEAAGLLAVSLGLSRMYADDLEQLEAGMLLYDALYRWCRDAADETHNWHSAPKKKA